MTSPFTVMSAAWILSQGWDTVRVCNHLEKEIYVRLLTDVKGAFQKMLAQKGVRWSPT